MSGTEQPTGQQPAPVSPAAPASEPAPTPTALTPAPTALTPATTAVTVAPAETVAPAQAPSEPAFTPHTETPTLLQQAEAKRPEPEKPAADKPAEAKPAEAKAAEEPKPPEPAPEPRTYEAFALPEGVQPDPEQMQAATELFGKLGLSQEHAQALVTRHTEAMHRYAEGLAADQHRVFAETRAEWRNEILADEQIGGSGHQTAMKAIARMRDLAVPAEDRAAFDQFCAITGAGDHPAFLRMLHNFARFLDEPRAPQHTAPKPPPDAGVQPGTGRRLRGLYTSQAMQNLR